MDYLGYKTYMTDLLSYLENMYLVGPSSRIDAYWLSRIENINFPSLKTNISASERLDGVRIATANYIILKNFPSPSQIPNGVVCLPIVEISPSLGRAQDITMWLLSMAPTQLGICLPWKVTKASRYSASLSGNLTHSGVRLSTMAFAFLWTIRHTVGSAIPNWFVTVR